MKKERPQNHSFRELLILCDRLPKFAWNLCPLESKTIRKYFPIFFGPFYFVSNHFSPFFFKESIRTYFNFHVRNCEIQATSALVSCWSYSKWIVEERNKDRGVFINFQSSFIYRFPDFCLGWKWKWKERKEKYLSRWCFGGSKGIDSPLQIAEKQQNAPSEGKLFTAIFFKNLLEFLMGAMKKNCYLNGRNDLNLVGIFIFWSKFRTKEESEETE